MCFWSNKKGKTIIYVVLVEDFSGKIMNERWEGKSHLLLAIFGEKRDFPANFIHSSNLCVLCLSLLFSSSLSKWNDEKRCGFIERDIMGTAQLWIFYEKGRKTCCSLLMMFFCKVSTKNPKMSLSPRVEQKHGMTRRHGSTWCAQDDDGWQNNFYIIHFHEKSMAIHKIFYKSSGKTCACQFS